MTDTNGRQYGRIHSYYEAPKVAMEMIEENGLHPQAFYDEIPSRGKKTYMLNYKGSNLLAGLMGVHITEILETEESDESEVVVKATAENPNGNKGWAWLSRPKQDSKNEEDDWREKIYTHAKRNALRDLIPYGVFLEMLVRKATVNNANAKQNTNAKQAEPPKQQAQQQAKPKTNTQAQPKQQAAKTPLDAAKELAKLTWSAERESLKNLHGVEPAEVLEFAQNKFDAIQENWTASQFTEFVKMLENPAEHGMKTAYSDPESEEEVDQAEAVEQEPDLLSGEEIAEDADDAETSEEGEEGNGQPTLEDVMSELDDLEGESK